MPSKRPEIVNGEIYHIVTRTIEGIDLFRGDKDYFRMINNLFEFNDENPVSRDYRRNLSPLSLPRNDLGENRKKRKLLVEILAFCLMPNHIHLLIKQTCDNGISKLMHKIGAGYSGYYNKKYERNGHLFQGRYRIVRIETEERLETVFVYIHTNPMSLIILEWKNKGVQIENIDAAIDFLENKYKWSSYPDYLGKKNFPSLTNREFLEKIMEGADGCREFVNNWLKFKKELVDFEEVVIE
ncbi:transposase [Patescibacteria group bacterium]|nr:transposase [Patescibacteria group bacterium]MBU4162154.1 transposase [Patescibacteria group bacterium]